jgi:hypothetical protein
MELSDIIGKELVNIWVKPFDPALTTYELVCFEFDEFSLIISVIEDFDELDFDILYDGLKTDYSMFKLSEINQLLKEKVVSGIWTAHNHNGFLDVFMLGTNEFKPNIILSIIASQINIDLL